MAAEILGLPVVSCMALGKLLNFSVPQGPDSYNERGSIYSYEVVWRIKRGTNDHDDEEQHTTGNLTWANELISSSQL